jgi:pyruvate kinase
MILQDTAPDRFCTNTPQVISDVCVGQRLLINDGAIVLRVEDKQAGLLRCRVIVGGAISSHKGLNLPDTDLGLPAITDQDWEWIAWAIRQELDYLALSFVRTAEEIRSLKKYLEKQGSPIKVVAKIEKLQAIENLEPIIRETDAVMVARGDLGVEMDLSEVPLVQKNITRLCRTHGKPVIVATQVLQSMIDNSFPPRAEVSDIANAVMDFADAVMLSGESAVGKYPLEAVKTIHTVCGKTEAFLEKTPFIRPKMESLPTYQQIEAIARSIAQMLDEVTCELIVAATESGTTASLLSKARIHVPITGTLPHTIDRPQVKSALWNPIRLLRSHHSDKRIYRESRNNYPKKSVGVARRPDPSRYRPKPSAPAKYLCNYLPYPAGFLTECLGSLFIPPLSGIPLYLFPETLFGTLR